MFPSYGEFLCRGCDRKSDLWFNISANLFLFVETDKVIRVSFACLLIKLRYFCLFQLTSRVTELVGMSFFRDMLLGVWEEGIHGFSNGMVTSLEWHDTLCLVYDFVRFAV